MYKSLTNLPKSEEVSQIQSEIHYCDYGCGQVASYMLKNGKYCCNQYPQQCPNIRVKNSSGVKAAHKKGIMWNETNAEQNRASLLKGLDTHRKNCLEKAFTENSTISNASLKKYLIDYFHWELRCNCCGLTEWQGQNIPLELHHKNGNPTDNRLENLDFLCLNCHAITDNFRGKNIDNKGATKVTDDALLKALETHDSIRAALLSVGLAAKGGNYSRVYNLLSKNL